MLCLENCHQREHRGFIAEPSKRRSRSVDPCVLWTTQRREKPDRGHRWRVDGELFNGCNACLGIGVIQTDTDQCGDGVRCANPGECLQIPVAASHLRIVRDRCCERRHCQRVIDLTNRFDCHRRPRGILGVTTEPLQASRPVALSVLGGLSLFQQPDFLGGPPGSFVPHQAPGLHELRLRGRGRLLSPSESRHTDK